MLSPEAVSSPAAGAALPVEKHEDHTQISAAGVEKAATATLAAAPVGSLHESAPISMATEDGTVIVSGAVIPPSRISTVEQYGRVPEGAAAAVVTSSVLVSEQADAGKVVVVVAREKEESASVLSTAIVESARLSLGVPAAGGRATDRGEPVVAGEAGEEEGETSEAQASKGGAGGGAPGRKKDKKAPKTLLASSAVQGR